MLCLSIYYLVSIVFAMISFSPQLTNNLSWFNHMINLSGIFCPVGLLEGFLDILLTCSKFCYQTLLGELLDFVLKYVHLLKYIFFENRRLSEKDKGQPKVHLPSRAYPIED